MNFTLLNVTFTELPNFTQSDLHTCEQRQFISALGYLKHRQTKHDQWARPTTFGDKEAKPGKRTCPCKDYAVQNLRYSTKEA